MKRFEINLLLAGIIMSTIWACATKENSNKDMEIDTEITGIISKMTLEQKAQVLIGTGFFMNFPEDFENEFKPEAEIPKDYAMMVDTIRSYCFGAAGFTAEFPDLGITSQVLADGPAGLRISPTREGEEKTYYCTAFPIATLLASSWDQELVQKVGEAMGEEVLEYGADVLLAPGMNLHRDPLCGRNFEYYSEDPLLCGKMAAAMVNGVQSKGVGTSIKHFAANNQETNRMTLNTVVSTRALRELYLKGFEIAVKESQPWTVMSAYNRINEQYASESHDLLTKVLRDDWGFEGYVVTDWGAGVDVIQQMKVGNDLIMPGRYDQVVELVKKVESGDLSEETIDRNIARIFKIMLKTPRYKNYPFTNEPDLAKNAKIARQAATDGMVLLENRNKALPLAEEIKSVAAFGNSSYEFISGGTGSGDVNEAYTVPLVEGLHNAGYKTLKYLEDTYSFYIKDARAKAEKPKNWLAEVMGATMPVTEMEVSKELAEQVVNQSDVALITIGRNSGEAGDREPIPGDFYLTEGELNLIKNVTEVYHQHNKKVIVVLNIGGPIETNSWSDLPDAVLLAWQPGQEAGNAVVDIISGKVNPSGKLTVSFPEKYDDAPTAKNFPGYKLENAVVDSSKDLSGFAFLKNEPWEVVYEEDIYVGYRYYNTFKVPVSYEFGYGLSYTNFEYSNLELGAQTFEDMLEVSVEVKNTGKVAGREVVQIYIKAPEKKLEKPEIELKAFGKTKLLQPGESEVLKFNISKETLASFDEQSSSWIIEPGDYMLYAAASALNKKQEAEFNVGSVMQVEKVSNALAPKVAIDKLTR